MGLLMFRERASGDRTPFKKNEFHVGQRDSTAASRSPIRRQRHATSSDRTSERVRAYYQRRSLPVMEPDPDQPSSSESLNRMMYYQDRLRLPPPPPISPQNRDRLINEQDAGTSTMTLQPPQAWRLASSDAISTESSAAHNRLPSPISAVAGPGRWPPPLDTATLVREARSFSRNRGPYEHDVDRLSSPAVTSQFAPAYRFYQADTTPNATPPSERAEGQSTPSRGMVNHGDETPADGRLMLDGASSPQPVFHTPALAIGSTSGLGDRHRSPSSDSDRDRVPERAPAHEDSDSDQVSDSPSGDEEN
ncbi:MAG: hypothetical protein LQ340_002780, partial [Diploschistes diacapsis]